MKVNFSTKISQLNRAKRIGLDYLLAIPLHGPVSFRQVVFKDSQIDGHIHRRSGSTMSLKVCSKA